MGRSWGSGVAFLFLAGLAGCSSGGQLSLGKTGAGGNPNACIVSDGIGGGELAVPCPTEARFTIGGTVTGFAGTLVLDNLAIDTLPITSGGAFTFSVAMADGTPYRVTVTNQPSQQGHICTVENGEGIVAGVDVTDVVVACVATEGQQTQEFLALAVEPPAFGSATGALYPDAPHWNDYVRNDGAGPFSASGAPCDGTELGSYGTCLHAGEIRAFEVPGVAGCQGLEGRDDLDAFDWTCDDTGGAVRMRTSALRSGVHLSDLIDFAAGDWRPNALRVSDAGGELFATAPAPWWGNPVVATGAGADLVAPGVVYAVGQDATGDFRVLADHVALVVAPGATLRGADAAGSVVGVRNAAFAWIEGRIDAGGDADGIRADGLRFSVLDRIRVQRALHAGVYLNDARANRLTDLASVQNDAYGVRADAAVGNVLQGLMVAGNALSGLHVNGGADNRIVDVTAAGNGNWGVALRGTWGNVLVDVTATDQAAYGVWLDRSPGHTLMNLATVNNGSVGLYLFESSGAVLANVASTDNGLAGIALANTSGNHVTGHIVTGGNARGCTEVGGVVPGLENITCEGRDGSDPVVTTGATLAASFVGRVLEDDPAHPQDVAGAATADALSDWLSFANPYRQMGRNAFFFPDTQTRGRCTEGTCRIWDWSLNPDDEAIRHLLDPPSGEAALSPAWSDGPVTLFLPNAVEFLGDGIGNDNALCESGETCLYTPNPASDQGAEALVPAGFIGTGGPVENVTLFSRGEIPPKPAPAVETTATPDTTGTPAPTG